MTVKPEHPLSFLQIGVAATLFCVSLAAMPNTAVELESARESLTAARVTLARTIEELRTLLNNNGLTQTEKEDFLSYINKLRQVVEDNCLEVLKIKSELNDDTPEDGCETSGSGSAQVSFPEEKTEDERVATLEDQLRSSMSEFDELLLREMEKLERQRSSAGGPSGGATGSGEGSGETGTSGETSASESTAESGQQESGADQQGQQQTATAARTTESGQQQSGSHGGGQSTDPTGSKVTRDEPPDQGDDDIVARQLREAAENETDPVLREKLWEEYRRYKADTTAKSN